MRPWRPPVIHVVLLDGTFASLADGRRSAIGRIHRLLRGDLGPLPPGPRVRVHYGCGQQWDRWRTTLPDLVMGRVLETTITAAYGWLASAYSPGDAVFFFGYSRGAFAVRSLAGMIGRVGLLRPEAATERAIRLAWRSYADPAPSAAALAMLRRRCHPAAQIRMVGCFDTVKALGLRLPLLWMLTEPRFRFHDDRMGPHVDHGVQALALDETRAAFAPLLWNNREGADRIEQRWFRGCHPDIGGQLGGVEAARPLANIPLVWMLAEAQEAGLPLPRDWRRLLPCDPAAPAVGSWRGWGKAFLARAPRTVGYAACETLDASVPHPYRGPAQLAGGLSIHSGPRLARAGGAGRGLTEAG